MELSGEGGTEEEGKEVREDYVEEKKGAEERGGKIYRRWVGIENIEKDEMDQTNGKTLK